MVDRSTKSLAALRQLHQGDDPSKMYGKSPAGPAMNAFSESVAPPEGISYIDALQRAQQREQAMAEKSRQSRLAHGQYEFGLVPETPGSMLNPSWAAWFEAADKGRTPLDQPINLKLRQEGTMVDPSKLGDISNTALEALRRQSQSFAGPGLVFKGR